MGDDVEHQEFSRGDRTRYREKVRRSLDVLARMLREEHFEAADPMAGLEVELNLIDADGRPALKNADVLEALDDDDFQTELGQFNVEINHPPVRPREHGLEALERGLQTRMERAEQHAERVGAHLVMVGILPTLTEDHFRPESLTANPRYHLLDQQMLNARGEDLAIGIGGRDRLELVSSTIIPEAACTSTQFHLQVRPEEFAPVWNASQAIAGIQLAIGANSPYLLGRELWRETRIPLFEQATDTRSEELKAQGVRPRVWFGERWITSVFDLFEENVKYFPALLPVLEDEDPAEALAAGAVPTMSELRLHNGTIYRWNRPVYDVVGTGADAVAHLRVENRVLPAGPTVIDTLANAAFYLGTVRALARSSRPLWSQLSFAAAEENFHRAARIGIDAQLYWPGIGQAPASEIVLRKLLPLAHRGLASWGVESRTADRLLGVIEQRCLAHTGGAEWLVAEVDARQGAGANREDALRQALLEYRQRMWSGAPVHEWR